MNNKKIKIAFIKYLGLITAGTEKFLQTIAAGLPKDEFEVDYYFAHPEDNPPNENRKQYLLQNGVNLIEFKTSTPRVHRGKIWLDKTNFYDVFDKNNLIKKYDLIQTGRCGLFEEPFCNIRNIPIIDSYHYVVGADNQYNVARIMHISYFSRRKWIEAGGDNDRAVMVSHPIVKPEIPSESLSEKTLSLSEGTENQASKAHSYKDFRSEFDIGNKFVFGFHQRNDNAIFSEIPLKAFKEISSNKNAFLILGGGDNYRKQAEELRLQNVFFIGHTGDSAVIYSFIKAIDVYAHGRKDGELNSTAIAEALYFGKPVVSHFSDAFNGHSECIGSAGYIVENHEQYAEKLLELQENRGLYEDLQAKALARFREMYDYEAQLNNIIKIYRDAVKNPYPNKIKRLWLDLKQQFPLRRHRRYN